MNRQQSAEEGRGRQAIKKKTGCAKSLILYINTFKMEEKFRVGREDEFIG